MLCMREDSYCLFESDAGKPFEKFIYRGAGFKVLKQRAHRDASATKNPGTTEFAFASLYLLTISPVQHARHDMLHSWHGQ